MLYRKRTLFSSAAFFLTLILIGTRAPLWAERSSRDMSSRQRRQSQAHQAAASHDDKRLTLAHAFRLRDQFDRLHAYRFPRSQVSVLIMADRRGSKQLKGWLQPISERFEKQINLGGIANKIPIVFRAGCALKPTHG